MQQLQALHIEAAGFAADVMNAAQLEAALARVKETFGPVDMLECSPLPSWTDPASAPVSVLLEQVLKTFKYTAITHCLALDDAA